MTKRQKSQERVAVNMDTTDIEVVVAKTATVRDMNRR